MKITNYKSLLTKVEEVTKQKGLDLSSGEDLSIGVMNLISIEEHLFFTFNKTKDNKYLDLLNEIRLMRTELLREIIKDYEGEVWCISKHLLAASMRVMEVGTKELKKNNKEKAAKLFEKSYQLYSLFWGLNLGVVSTKDIRSNTKDDEEITLINDRKTENGKQSTVNESVFSKLGVLLQRQLTVARNNYHIRNTKF